MLFVLPLLVLMLAVFLVPALMVLWTSVHADGTGPFTLQYFEKFFTGELYLRVLENTISISFVATAVTALLGYPVAYYLSRQPPGRRLVLSTLLLLPFYTSILVKSFAFTIVLGHNGLVNGAVHLLLGQGHELALLHNRAGAIIGIVQDMLPFLVLPLMVNLIGQDRSLHKAAEIMGAGRLRIFWRITFPLSLPGLLAGVLLVVVRAMGQFATPTLLGGRQDTMLAPLVDLQISQFIDWSMASAVSVVLLVVASIFLAGLAFVRGGNFLAGRA
jgi:ABC-type spermidine/putrescine transport system permease subunit I